MPSLKCCATNARLSIAFRNEGDGGSLERPEPNFERDGQVGAKNGCILGQCGREGGHGQQEDVTGDAVLGKAGCVSDSQLYWASEACVSTTEPKSIEIGFGEMKGCIKKHSSSSTVI